MKYISVLGDSISTFEGCNPPGYKVYYDIDRQQANAIYIPGKTWWGRVIDALGGRLCVNNSYSGSLVSGTQYHSGCSDERTSGLHNASCRPDIILIYMGFNDYGYCAEPEFVRGEERDAFEPAYRRMLALIRKNYPEAEVVCGTIMRSCLRFDDAWVFPERFSGFELTRYNGIIRRVCEEQGCLLADLSSLGMLYETLDGSHPTSEGHKTMAAAWIKCLAGLGFDVDANIF